MDELAGRSESVRRLALNQFRSPQSHDTGARGVILAKINAAIEGLVLQKPSLPISALDRQILWVAHDPGERPSDTDTESSS